MNGRLRSCYVDMVSYHYNHSIFRVYGGIFGRLLLSSNIS